MPTAKDRLSVTIEPEWKPFLETLKRTQFYDKSYAKMWRHIIKMGMDAIATNTEYGQAEKRREASEKSTA